MTDTQLLHIKISRAMYRALNRIRRNQNKTLSAVVREALAEYIERESGEIIDPTDVSWGGYREPTNDTENSADPELVAEALA